MDRLDIASHWTNSKCLLSVSIGYQFIGYYVPYSRVVLLWVASYMCMYLDILVLVNSNTQPLLFALLPEKV